MARTEDVSAEHDALGLARAYLAEDQDGFAAMVSNMTEDELRATLIVAASQLGVAVLGWANRLGFRPVDVLAVLFGAEREAP